MYKVYFDGSCKEGWVGFGFVVYYEHEDVYSERDQFKAQITSNNIAEYVALIRAIRYCRRQGIQKVQFIGDSLMVINQMLGKCKARNGSYMDYYKAAKTMIKDIEAPSFKWVPRKENKIADKLSKIKI